NSVHERRNGILYLKGGDLTEELMDYKTVEIIDLPDFYEEEFFDTKKVVYLPMKFKG
ncbi:MAG: 16S rRNA (guanine(527)-N(7))-methyltransferase RsmG, partial [Flavobacteriales bacterium]